MKPIIINNKEEAKERHKSVIAMYMSRSVGVEFTKDRVNALRKNGFEIVEIWKPLHLSSEDMFHIFYNKSKVLKKKDERKANIAQPDVPNVPKFNSI